MPAVAPTEVSACDFGYNGTSTDKAAAQAALETAFDTWMADVLAAFNSGVGGGCAPIATPTGTAPTRISAVMPLQLPGTWLIFARQQHLMQPIP